MKILIIEDEESLAKILKMGLKKEGITADYVLDGELGQKRLELYHNDYDAVVLDLMLPKKNGLEVLKAIREQNVSVPVLILTAKDSVADKIALLDAGADDYLVKPFNFSEVLARLRALTRRPENVLPTELRIDDLVLVPKTKIVTRGGKEIKLTLKEFRLLEYLMRHPDQALERENIFSNIWDFQSNSFSNIVDVYINRLRSKIDSNGNRKLLETVQGIGYKLKSTV
ncbi:MAG: response regulator transcription factor [Dehalococcoidales bacterium]|nr:response regulator transcription factor [Dehalococcoidales bacterium]